MHPNLKSDPKPNPKPKPIQNFIFENQKILTNSNKLVKIENEIYTNKQTDYIKLFDKYFEAITILYVRYNQKTIKSLEYEINPKMFRSQVLIK